MKYCFGQPEIKTNIFAEHPVSGNRNLLLNHLLQLRKGLKMFLMCLTNHVLGPCEYFTNEHASLFLGINKNLFPNLPSPSLLCSFFSQRNLFRVPNRTGQATMLQDTVSQENK